MYRFTTKIVNMMKAERLFETQGGPIILSQIENEYGPMEYELGAPGQAYTKWAAKMGVGLQTGVHWVYLRLSSFFRIIVLNCSRYMHCCDSDRRRTEQQQPGIIVLLCIGNNRSM